MTPKREEFILDVRRTVRTEQKPTVTTDSDLINPDAIARALQRAALWLTPKTVEGYDPEDFREWPSELQEKLRLAVDGFRESAATVPADKAATREQFAAGQEAFHRLIEATREVVLWEWTKAAEALIAMVEEWAKESGWVTRRVDKKMTETLLGTYSMQQVLLHAAPCLYVLDPVARFVPGAAGAFDLSVQPSYYLTSLYRAYDGNWHAHFNGETGVKSGRREAWNKDAFKKCVEELRALL